MKKNLLRLFQTIIILIGLAALVFMLWEPHIEGRNANATFFQIYFNDLFLAYAYATSIAFFFALYQAFKLLGYAGRNEIFSERSVKALRIIKYCAIIIAVAIGAAVTYLFVVRPGDDIAGGVAIGLAITFISVGIAALAAVLEGRLRNAIKL